MNAAATHEEYPAWAAIPVILAMALLVMIGIWAMVGLVKDRKRKR